jgi:Tfp pilus assembly protein PilE
MIKLNKNNNNKNGFTVLETLLYVSFFALLSIVVINSLIIMMKSFKETQIQSELTQGSILMEKISREIRQAYIVNSISVGDLKVSKKDNAGAITSVRFSLVQNDIQFFENDILKGNLNPANVVVDDLNFSQINTLKGSAIKIILTTGAAGDSQNRTEDFYDTVVLRGDY